MTPPRLLALIAPLSLAACQVGGADLSWEFPARDLEGVDLMLVNGSITALPAPDDVLRIEWSGGGVGNRNLRPEPVVRDGVVYLDARCGEACGGDLVAWLPAGLDVSAQVDKGDVTVELPARADVRACAGIGAVDIGLPAGKWDLQLQVGVGELTVEGVADDPGSSEQVQACTDVGDLAVWGWDPEPA